MKRALLANGGRPRVKEAVEAAISDLQGHVACGARSVACLVATQHLPSLRPELPPIAGLFDTSAKWTPEQVQVLANAGRDDFGEVVYAQAVHLGQRLTVLVSSSESEGQLRRVLDTPGHGWEDGRDADLRLRAFDCIPAGFQRVVDLEQRLARMPLPRWQDFPIG